jgi:Spy/CpxP family protein refolding chaperone
MKKITLFAALMAAFVVAAGQAWAGGSCCPMGKKSAAGAAIEKSCSSALSGIELSDDQKTKIAAIEEACKAEGKTVEACKDSMAKIRDVLSEDQRASFDAAVAAPAAKEDAGS